MPTSMNTPEATSAGRVLSTQEEAIGTDKKVLLCLIEEGFDDKVELFLNATKGIRP